MGHSESSCVGVHGPVAANALGLPSQVAQAPGPAQQQAAEGPIGQGTTNSKSSSLCPIQMQSQCHPHCVLGCEKAQHRGQWRPTSGHSEPAQSWLIGSTGRQWLPTYPPGDCNCGLEPAQQYKGVGGPGAHDAIKREHGERQGRQQHALQRHLPAQGLAQSQPEQGKNKAKTQRGVFWMIFSSMSGSSEVVGLGV